MSLVYRLMLGMGLAVLLALIFTVGTITTLTSRQLDSFNYESVRNDYTGKLNQNKTALSNYFGLIENQIIQMAADSSTKEAAQAFIYALEYLPGQAKLDINEIRPDVEAYYRNEFAREFDKYNDSQPNYDALVSQLDDLAILLQYMYIVDNPNPLGAKSELIDSGRGNSYNYEHIRRHSDFKTVLERFNYYDIFIADIVTGHVLYSVYKELDYGTNLINGPFSNSGLAEAFNRARDLNEGETHFTTFSDYFPSYNATAGFVSTPIFNIEGERIAVLIFQMPIISITNQLTQSQNWQENGFGLTGEAYLIGGDLTMRSESRGFLEAPEQFIETIREDRASYASEVSLRETTVGIHTIDNVAVRAALSGESGFTTTVRHDIEHLTAYAPFQFGDVEWALITEIEKNEAYAESRRLVSTILTSSAFVTIVILLLVLVFTVFFARLLIKPLNALSQRFELLNSADADLTTRVDGSGIPEIDRISSGFNTFIAQIHTIVGTVKQNADLIASASTELSATTQQANTSAQLQQQESEKVTDALQQFNVAIEEVASQSNMASESTSNARDTANQSSQQSQLSNNKIKDLVSEISDASHNLTDVQAEVSSIVDLLSQITSIADQTNLLALNAAIEAARAGESGRGFAVVADEVRSLAMRTQESTVQIHEATERLNKTVSSAVKSMSRATGSAADGIELVDQVTAKIQELDDAVSSLAEINQSVAAAAEEQKYTAGAISENVDIVTQSSIELGESAEQVATASLELSRIAAELSDNVSRFKT